MHLVKWVKDLKWYIVYALIGWEPKAFEIFVRNKNK